MAHKVEFDENIRAVRVTHYGVCDLTDLTQAREKAVVMLQEHRVASILVDTTAIKNTPSTITSFEFSSTHKDVISYDVKIAVVVDVLRMKDGLFAETVAVNRGISMKMFQEEKNALAWLFE